MQLLYTVASISHPPSPQFKTKSCTTKAAHVRLLDLTINVHGLPTQMPCSADSRCEDCLSWVTPRLCPSPQAPPPPPRRPPSSLSLAVASLHILVCLAYRSSSVSAAAGETPAEVVTTSWRPYELWDAPGVYSMILKAAHDGAQAMVDSPSGHLMRMVSNVMVRVDVVLGAQWDHTGQVLLWPMINEMDWFNSAGMLTSFWKGSLPVGVATDEQNVPFGSEDEGHEMPFEGEAGEGGSRGIRAVQGSAGFKIAQALYKEILGL